MDLLLLMYNISLFRNLLHLQGSPVMMLHFELIRSGQHGTRNVAIYSNFRSAIRCLVYECSSSVII